MSVNTCSQSMSGLRSPAFSNVPSGHGALYRKLHTCNAGAWGARRRLSQLSAGTPKLLLTAGKHTRVALKTQVRKFSESVGNLVEIHLCEHLRCSILATLGTQALPGCRSANWALWLAYRSGAAPSITVPSEREGVSAAQTMSSAK